ncbi:RING-H2 finger protein ATL78 isoform X1 [Physcomitrium patens]|uniref:RING-type domain-containing protein n=1 Tax=Physcomitrium patens TaxID=3218 RepID=A0A2K1J030_PHYPA|nr:RING-H2 finger protein ATL73-like [Physcomitrium patens]XP_024401728.1 RING-H2 finger protein ATL73-like [Physcomitrium patens]XP_024401729.1 RING-H2 finger protein ATL73-like [Physcomitrium patens]XP_024401730.1 RING-H2 finger protein ATL73-like [Physcomitrium patens]PNR34881.1 hypothetical protein PHYPA_022779 [Physcomitrium patens]|eukprot:XP_024401727.1 RING-H2 finger protein ATL73-like [Physcomitrella patens]
MAAGLRRLDVHFGSSRVTVNVSDYIPLPSPSPLHLRRPSHDPPGPAQAPYFARSLNSNVVVVMAVLLFALVVAAFINTIVRCLVRRRRQQPVDDHNDTEKGLQKSAIEALPLFDSLGGKECVVCLSEFASGEKVRLLPICKHGFHPFCIEKWLLTRTTCPVCRCSVLPAESYSKERH